MKKYILFKIQFVITNIIKCIYSIALVILFSKKSNIKSLKIGNNECLILGNGPSLKDDINKNPNIFSVKKDFICVNDFVKSDYFELLHPTHYVLLDPFYWEGDQEELVLFFNHISVRTKWRLNLFLPQEIKNISLLDESGINENKFIKIYRYNRTPIDGFNIFNHVIFKSNLGMPWAQNVLVAAIFIAINIGYKKIYLLGADHSWHEELEVGDDNIVYVKQKHFYDGDIVKRKPVYKKSMNMDQENNRFKMFEIFEAWGKMFRGYCILDQYAVKVGVKIYNAGSKSFIDAFERVEAQNIL